ncbi:EAL domain-containing protein [Arenibaculum pallidiluteum]|uniref:EAL domain-containing protein n=1 Tax=Arenibaculum pallidiluteum TaxID=2812559 RepID=UPI001A973F45|nr:EAL domain-containing protein [Arenibaculum pallidiluteum]
MHCPDCERVDPLFHDRNRVLLGFPTAHAAAKFLHAAVGRGLGVGAEALTAEIVLAAPELETLAGAAESTLSTEEMQKTRALVLDAQALPSPQDWLAVRPLAEVVGAIRGRWLVRMIEGDRLRPAFQPIFDRSGAAYGHEALLRGLGEDGALVGGGRLIGVAEEAGMLFTVDQIGRRQAIEGAARAGLNGHLFVNFNPTSIYDPEACLGTTFDAVRRLGLNPRTVVFEVTESTQVRDRTHLLSILDYYRRAGFLVALDDVGAGFSGLSLLREVKPDVIKIDMDLVRDVDQDRFRQSIVTHLAAIARENGALILAEGIETEAEHRWLQGAGIDLFQGFGLGRPVVPACLL